MTTAEIVAAIDAEWGTDIFIVDSYNLIAKVVTPAFLEHWDAKESDGWIPEIGSLGILVDLRDFEPWDRFSSEPCTFEELSEAIDWARGRRDELDAQLEGKHPDA